MLKDTDIAWLAGLIDGEGCLYLAVRSDNTATRVSRRTGETVQYGPYFQVRCDFKLAMADRETIVTAAGMIAEILGTTDGVLFREERRKVVRARPLWRVELSSKGAINTLLRTIRPFVRTKAIEADLCLDYLSHLLITPWHKATLRDLELARLATELRHGSGEARAQAIVILSQVTPSQAAEGTDSTSGSAEGLETSRVSASNNPGHERPAPHLAAVGGERVKT